MRKKGSNIKTYNIRNEITGNTYQVKVLYRTKNLVLHRPVNYPIDSKIRTYVISYIGKDSDFMLNMYFDTIGVLKQHVDNIQGYLDELDLHNEHILPKDNNFKQLCKSTNYLNQTA